MMLPAKIAGKRYEQVAAGKLALVFDQLPGWHHAKMINVAMADTVTQSMPAADFEMNVNFDARDGELLFTQPDFIEKVKSGEITPEDLIEQTP